MPRSILSPWVISGTTVLLHPGFVLMSMACVTRKGHLNVCVWYCWSLKPCWYQWHCYSGGGGGGRTYWYECALDAIWGHGDVLVHANSEGHVLVHGPAASGLCVDAYWPMLPPKAVQMSVGFAAAWTHVDVIGSYYCRLIWMACAATWCQVSICGAGYLPMPCLCPRSYFSKESCLWSMLSPETVKRPMICVLGDFKGHGDYNTERTSYTKWEKKTWKTCMTNPTIPTSKKPR